MIKPIILCLSLMAMSIVTTVVRAQGALDKTNALLPGPKSPDPGQLEKVRTLYEEARKKLGGEHVLLTAAAYLGKKPKKSDEGEKSDLQGGVAGIVSVPLVGAGGGHGLDWYPVLQTEEATKAFERFENEVKQYVALADNVAAAGQDPVLVLRTLEDAAKTLLEQLKIDDGEFVAVASAAEACLDTLRKQRALFRIDVLRAPTASGDEEMDLSAQPLDRRVSTAKREAIRAIEEEKSWWRPNSLQPITDVRNSCYPLIGAVAGLKSPKAQLQALRNLLLAYWRTLEQRGATSALKRHAFLIGPAIGLPVTENPGSVALVGGLLEVGASYFRVGVTGGVQLRYSALDQDPGWFAGLSVSGALGDDLFHFFNGGLTAARGVVTAK